MTWADLRAAWLRMASLWKRRRHERELAEEMEFHMAMKMSAGQSPQQANREFGGFEKWKEVCRDVDRWRFAEELGRDLVLAVRMLRKSPVFTLVALVTLTLAIGANTAIFSLMNELIIKSVPVPNAKRLAIVRIQPDEFGYTFSYPLLQAIEKRSGSVMNIFTYTRRVFQLRGNEGVEAVAGELVSGQYFSALGMKPQMGRWISPQDDRPGAPGGMVAVVSNHFWRSRMGADKQPIGRTITINQGAFTVVGVMPKEFRGMDRDSLSEVFVPFQLEPFTDAPFNMVASGFGSWWFQIGGYLKDGVSLQQANAFLRTVSPQCFQEITPNGSKMSLNGHQLRDLHLIAESGENGTSFLRLRFRKPLAVLMGLVAIVLLIACLNLATLLTARSASRGREISTRFALGASRARLLRQLLTESLLLAVTGTSFGLAASPALTGFMSAMLAPNHDPQSATLNVALDPVVFAFTALIAILATVLTGTLPAIRTTGGDVQGAMREASGAIRGAERRHWWPRLLLAFEVALSLVLVTGASLLGYSMVKLHEIPAGFEARGLMYLQLDMQKQQRKMPALIALYRELVSNLEAIPGVKAVSSTSIVPITMTWSTETANVPGGPQSEVWRSTAGPDYFLTMKTPLLEGREFRWDDTEASGKKLILSQAAVRLLFPKGKALGEHVSLDAGKTFAEVVGIVADAKYTTMRDAPPATVYSAITQDSQDVMGGAFSTLLIRSDGLPAAVIASVRRTIHRMLPDIPVPAAVNMEDTVAESLATERIMATLALFFGGLALLITGIGLYGTLAYATERRTGEIGIRLALGARPRNVISMVCTENVIIALIGCIIGIAGSVMASKTIASFLYGVSARDPYIFGIAALLLLCVATFASLLPATKASKIDPIAAIRYE